MNGINRQNINCKYARFYTLIFGSQYCIWFKMHWSTTSIIVIFLDLIVTDQSVEATRLTHLLQVTWFSGLPHIPFRLGLVHSFTLSFSLAGPSLWNALLPCAIRNSISLPAFRSRLKTHLFHEAFITLL